jgi:phosphoglycolate phosphatase
LVGEGGYLEFVFHAAHHIQIGHAGFDHHHVGAIGDDERDIVAGLAANMKTVAATYGYLGAASDVKRWQAHAQIDAPLALIPLLSF